MQKMKRILVVDDDAVVQERIVALLQKQGYQASPSSSGEESLARLHSESFDATFVDVQLPGLNGIELIGEIHEITPEMPVIVITAYGSLETAVDALRAGAFDYLLKPVKPHDLLLCLERAFTMRALEQENHELRLALNEGDQFGDLIGASAAMRKIFSMIRKIAQSTSNVLITGESGTGKDVLARTIHAERNHSDRAYIPINCSAIPDGLLESELFGHVKGAFTGAYEHKAGLFVEADGGTVFLDEIGELGWSLQTKLLRVLQDRAVRPVGSTETIPIDARIIAATNRNLKEAMNAGEFRKDLFYRLNVIPVHLPPLRERPEDIGPLAKAFLLRHEADRPRRLSESALGVLRRARWPGNARELENVIERTLALSDAEVIGAEQLIIEEPDADHPDGLEQVLESAAELETPLKQLEALYIAEVLRRTHGNKMQAARVLGVNRTTLYRRGE